MSIAAAISRPAFGGAPTSPDRNDAKNQNTPIRRRDSPANTRRTTPRPETEQEMKNKCPTTEGGTDEAWVHKGNRGPRDRGGYGDEPFRRIGPRPRGSRAKGQDGRIHRIRAAV